MSNVEMTDQQRLALKRGDIIIVRDDEGNESERRVRIAPWQLGHGQLVIGLEGISGGYALHRVVRLVKALEDFPP